MRKLLIVLLAAVLLAGYYFLGTGYLKQRQEQARLATGTAAAQQTLALVPTWPADLDLRLRDAMDAQAAAQKSLPVRMDTTQALNIILRLAEDCGVKAIPLATQPWTAEAIGGYEYSVFRLEMNVSGEFELVQSFLSRLETGEPGTLVLEYMRLTRPDGQPEGEPVEAGLRVAIYARAPDQP